VSAANVEVVRSGLQQLFLTGELPLDEMRPDFELHAGGEVYRGEEGFMQWLSDWARAHPHAVVEPVRYADAGDQVVAVLSLGDVEHGMTWTFEKGVVSRIDYYESADEALAAAGA
jgi:hypothetical protein